MICGFIGDNRPIPVTIIIEVPIIREFIIVVFEIVVQLTDFAPIIIIIAIIIIDPLGQNMVFIACFRKDKPIISLAVPPIRPNFSDDIVFIKHIIGISGQTWWTYQHNACCNGDYFLNHFENLLSRLSIGYNTIIYYCTCFYKPQCAQSSLKKSGQFL